MRTVVINWFSSCSGDMYSEDERKNNPEEPDWLKTEKEQFSRYRDKNGDGYMDKVNFEKKLTAVW